MPRPSNNRLPVKIRAAKADDVLAVCQIEQSHRPNRKFPHHYLNELENPLSRFYVSCLPDSGEVIGYILYWVIETSLEIHYIAVAPAYRRKGVGKGLMEYSIRQAEATGVDQIFLEVRESNRRAQQFYEGLDFVQKGRRKEYYRHPMEDALMYEKILNRTKKNQDSP